MRYTELLLKNELFLRLQQEIQCLEKDRIYCHHEIGHALDVCRMAWILYLETNFLKKESGQSVDNAELICAIKDRFYVTGLLHDIGRASQYRTGEHHSAAGVRLASQILKQIDFPEAWIDETLQIIGDHHGRNGCHWEKNQIGYYIEQADHLSRNCFCCEAAASCKWKEEDRNQTIVS